MAKLLFSFLLFLNPAHALAPDPKNLEHIGLSQTEIDFIMRCHAYDKTEIYTASLQINARPGCVHPAYGLDIGIIPLIVMGQYKIVDASTHSHLQSSSFNPCWALTIYDPISKSGMLAHLPPANLFLNEDEPETVPNSKLLDAILLNFKERGIPLRRLRVGIYGGLDPGPARNEDGSYGWWKNPKVAYATSGGLMRGAANGVRQIKKIFLAAGVTEFVIDGINVDETIYTKEPLGSFKIFDLETGSMSHFKLEPNFWLFSLGTAMDIDRRAKTSDIPELIPATP
jgi:hypothetical protein